MAAEPGPTDADLADLLDVLCDFACDADQCRDPWPAETLRPLRELAERLRRASPGANDDAERAAAEVRINRAAAERARAESLLCPNCHAKNRVPPADWCPWCLATRAREHDRLTRSLQEAVSIASPGDTGYEGLIAVARLWVDEDLRDGALTPEAAAERTRLLDELEARAPDGGAGGAEGACPLAAGATPNLPPPTGHADCGCAGEESPAQPDSVAIRVTARPSK